MIYYIVNCWSGRLLMLRFRMLIHQSLFKDSFAVLMPLVCCIFRVNYLFLWGLSFYWDCINKIGCWVHIFAATFSFVNKLTVISRYTRCSMDDEGLMFFFSLFCVIFHTFLFPPNVVWRGRRNITVLEYWRALVRYHQFVVDSYFVLLVLWSSVTLPFGISTSIVSSQQLALLSILIS